MLRDTGSTEFDALQFISRQVLNKVATATLVQVKAVQPGGTGPVGLVDVQPMVAQLDGYGNAVPHGTIFNVPYLRLQGGASAIIIDPVVGDIGLAWFASHDISSVKQTKKPGLPGSRRRFDWADALYMGGLLNGAPQQFIQIDPELGITITSATGKPVTINAPGGAMITSPTVTIDASDSLAITSPLVTMSGNLSVSGDTDISGDATINGDANINGDIAAGAGSTFNGKSFDIHTHSGVTTGSGHSGPPV